MSNFFAVVLPILTIFRIQHVFGHGRMVEPPSRASMWRYGFDSPVNYADNQLFCGGFTNQWEKNGGKCGVCGDPYDGGRAHEAGGKYARGIIVRRYKPGDILKVVIEITAPHGGWFEFRLCPNDDPRKAVSWDCLNRHVLSLADGSGERYSMEQMKPGFHKIHLQLPDRLTCAQCVLQWKYNAGNSWGVGDNGKGCVGCGPQEQFYACADVAIGNQTLPDNIKIPYWRDEYPDETTVKPVLTDIPYIEYNEIKNTIDIGLNDYNEEYIKAKLLLMVEYFFPDGLPSSATQPLSCFVKYLQFFSLIWLLFLYK